MGDSETKSCKRDADFDESWRLRFFSSKRTRIDGGSAVSPVEATSSSSSSSSSSGQSITAIAGEVERCCSSFCSNSNESCEIIKDSSSLRFVDLEVSNFETDISTFLNNNNSFSRETTPVSEICGETTMKTDSKPRNLTKISSPSPSPPSQVELDEFFAAAEKCEQKRFLEKYNYDVVKDAPVEGRYEWVCLKPLKDTVRQ